MECGAAFVQSTSIRPHLMSSATSTPSQYVLTLSCRDTKGIVYAVSGLLYEAGCNILDSQQFGDVLSSDATGLFFMRVHFEAAAAEGDIDGLVERFAPLRERFAMQ